MPPDAVDVEVRLEPIVQVGETVYIDCVFSLGTNYTIARPFLYLWWISENFIKSSPVHPDSAAPDGAITMTRTLHNVSEDHSGKYTCQLDNFGVSKLGSDTAELLVVDEGVCVLHHSLIVCPCCPSTSD